MKIACEYTMVAEARGQRVLWYRQFGSYQGVWLLLSCNRDRYYVYEDYYGSCSVCDAIQGEFGGGDVDSDDPKVQEFIKAYPSFLEMERHAARRVARRDGNLLAVLPANNRDFEGAGGDVIGRQLALVVLSEEREIKASEILEIDNLEGRRAAIERYGENRFVDEVGATLVETNGEDSLWRLEREGQEPFCFLHLKDASTDRRYVLRVSPEHRTVHAARAASFGMEPDRFVLSRET